jgi:hypothetical protein
MKVVHLVQGHNLHVDCHFKFGEEKLEKLAPRSTSTIQEHTLTFKVGDCFRKFCGEKPYIAFLKMIEGS